MCVYREHSAACEATERFNVHQALVWKLRHVTIESYTFYLRSDVLDLLPKSLPSRGGQSVGRSSDKGRLQSGEVEDTTSSEEEEEEEREEEEDDNDDDERQGQVEREKEAKRRSKTLSLSFLPLMLVVMVVV